MTGGTKISFLDCVFMSKLNELFGADIAVHLSALANSFAQIYTVYAQ